MERDMLDIFWNKTCKEKGVTPKAEIEKMKQQIQTLLEEIEDRKELIRTFSSHPSVLNQKHVARHEKGIVEAQKQIEEIQQRLDNSKKEFDK